MPELLAELFSSRVRAALLALVLPRPHLSFSLTELSRRLDTPVSSLQHECSKLTRLGLLRDERVGSARRYRPDPDFPLLTPLTALVLHAIPLSVALRGAAEGVPDLEAAWVAGDIERSAGPAYLVVIGRLSLEDLDGLFHRARAALTPVVSPERLELAYFLPRDWRARLGAEDAFTSALLAEPRIDMVDPGGGPGTSGP